MAERQFEGLLRIAPEELDLHFAPRLGEVNPAGEFVRSQRRVLVELGDQITQLEPGEIRRTVVDDSPNFQSPLLRARSATAASRVTDSQEALVPWIDVLYKGRKRLVADPHVSL